MADAAGIVPHQDEDILMDSMIRLGKNIRHRVIAEGVATREQIAFLSGHYCTEGQGYYLSRPLIAEELSALLKSGIPVNLFPPSSSLH